MKNLPKISICLPTYNNEKTIKECLLCIKEQNYPKEKVEILIIDGGSSDKTLEICKEYTLNIFHNKDKVEEKGRVLGIDKSKGEIIGFVDADNFLIDKDFFSKVAEVFLADESVIFCEPKYYYSRQNDDRITKYISAIGADDPVVIYLGIYDRYCHFKKRWTESLYDIVKKTKDYEIVRINDGGSVLPSGANGCFIAKDKLLKVKYDPFLHTDIICRLLKQNDPIMAKVNSGLIHKQDGSIISYLKKKLRRSGRDYKALEREYFFTVKKSNLIKLFFRCILIFPLCFDAIRGYFNKKDHIWAIHVPITIIVFWLYMFGEIKKSLGKIFS